MPHGRFDVVGVGYTALDCLGVIPHFPVENKKLEMLRFTVQGGGPAATATVAAGRLGLSTAYHGKIGDDDFGRRMLGELEREGVDVSSVIVEEGGCSQFAFIMVDERTAARTILWTRGENSPFTPGEVDLDLIRSARGLLIDSLEPAAALAAARCAHENGIPVLIDAGTLRDGIKELLPLCDHIIASETFAGQISGGGVGEALERIHSFGPKTAVVTLGERGCAAISGAGVVEVAGFPVKAVDTTGAGDVFHGAFMYAVLRGWDLYRMCVFANAVAAMKCTKPGGRAGIPDIEGVTAFLERERPDLDFR